MVTSFSGTDTPASGGEFQITLLPGARFAVFFKEKRVTLLHRVESIQDHP